MLRSKCALDSPYNIDPTGVVPIGPAFNAMWADLGPTGGGLYFPAGKYNCDGPVAPRIVYPIPDHPSTERSVTLLGDGPGATQFRSSEWARFAISVEMNDNRHSFHLDGVTFMAMASNCMGGLAVRNNSSFADFQRNTYNKSSFVARNEGAAGAYFNCGLQINNACGNSFTHLNFSGIPADIDHGMGLRIVGENPSSRVSIYNDVTSCHFHSLANGIEWGTLSQGLTVVQSNFGVVGCGIFCSPGQIQNQLNVVGGCFDVRRYPAIFILGGVQILVSTTLFLLGDGGNDNMAAIDIGAASGNSLIGNTIQGVSGQGHAGIKLRGGGSTIAGNYMSGLTYGIYADAGAHSVLEEANNFDGIPNPVAGPGAGGVMRG